MDYRPRARLQLAFHGPGTPCPLGFVHPELSRSPLSPLPPAWSPLSAGDSGEGARTCSRLLAAQCACPRAVHRPVAHKEAEDPGLHPLAQVALDCRLRLFLLGTSLRSTLAVPAVSKVKWHGAGGGFAMEVQGNQRCQGTQRCFHIF